MKRIPALAIVSGVTMLAFSGVHAAEPYILDLRPDAPQCRMPQAKRPTLGVNFKHDLPTEIKADFNGDGWCDYVLGVHYPLNSNMNAYDLDELMVLGQARGWKPVFNGKKGWELEDACAITAAAASLSCTLAAVTVTAMSSPIVSTTRLRFPP